MHLLWHSLLIKVGEEPEDEPQLLERRERSQDSSLVLQGTPPHSHLELFSCKAL